MNSRTIKNAEVADYQKRRKPSKHYVYVINVTWSDNSAVVIFRRYSRLFELQTKLFEEFPEESGVKDPSKRLLPFLPGKIVFGRSNIRDVAEKRKEPLNEYCQKLIKLPPKISECDLVLDFFEPTDEDISPVEDEQKEKKNDDESKAENISDPIQLEQYIVIADYQKQNRSEISLLAGDIVEVIEKNDNGWWFVNLEEEQGWVPASYLEPEDGSVENVVTTAYKPGDEKYIASTPYSAVEPDEIGFQKGVVVDVLQKNVDGWWLVRCNGKDGWAPAIYLKKIDPTQTLPKPHGYENVDLSNAPIIPSKPRRTPANDNSASKPPPRRSTVRRSHKVKNRVRTPPAKDGKPSASSPNEAIYVALSEYRSQGKKGRLSVQEGIAVEILEKSPNGWWYCKIGDEEGWIPSTHIQRQEKKSTPLGIVVEESAPQKTTSSRDSSDANYVAVYDYSDSEKLNISLKEGALVNVLQKNDSGWWYVQSGGAEGWAPSTYLEKSRKEKPKALPKKKPAQPRKPVAAQVPEIRLQPIRPPAPARPKPNKTGTKNEAKPAPPIPNRQKKPSLVRPERSPRLKPKNPTTGSVENLSVVSHNKPVVPLKQARSTGDLKSINDSGLREKPRAAPLAKDTYIVLADFKDNAEDTLDLRKGDRVDVLQQHEGGWWFAKLGGNSGWVPSSYLEKN